jgi:hypothetical protein
VTIDAEDTGGGLADLRLFHNGKLVSTSRSPRLEGRVAKPSIAVDLVPGTTRFVATAGTGEGREVVSEPCTIILSPPGRGGP